MPQNWHIPRNDLICGYIAGIHFSCRQKKHYIMHYIKFVYLSFTNTMSFTNLTITNAANNSHFMLLVKSWKEVIIEILSHKTFQLHMQCSKQTIFDSQLCS